MFEFGTDFQEFEKSFVAVVDGQEGYWDTNTGLYVPPTEPGEEPMQGIILPLNDDELKFDEGGTYTTEDRKILLRTSYHLAEQQEIRYKGTRYKVMRSKPLEDYADYNVFYVKKVRT